MYKVCLRGDQEAFATLCHKYIPALIAFFLEKIHDRQAAEDLTQDVFHQVWEKRKNYRPGTPDLSYLKGFARIVLKRYTSQHFSSNMHSDNTLDLDSVVDSRIKSPREKAQIEEQIQVLRKLITQLPKKQRQAVELIYLNELSIRTAANQSCCTEKTVRNNCRSGTEKLKEWLKP